MNVGPPFGRPWRALGAPLPAILAGAVLPLAFSPVAQGWLAPLALAWLFGSWWHARPRQALLRGWLFGLGMFGAGVSWVHVSLGGPGGVAPPLAFLMTAVMVAVLALFPGLAGALATRMTPPGGWRAGAAVPAAWVLTEWVRGWFLSGFPWLSVGYSQTDGWLGAWAPLAGVYGVGWLVALAAAALVLALRAPRQLWLPGAVAAAWLAGPWLDGLAWSQPAGQPLRAALIQGNIPQEQKWDAAFRDRIEARYRALTGDALGQDLVVWPEAAVPDLYADARERFLRPLAAELREAGTDLLFGVLVRDAADGRYYNALARLDDPPDFYYKRRLVPFGEYIPAESWLGAALTLLEIPFSSFTPGPARPPPLMAAGHPVAPAICYEVAFGDALRVFLPRARFLVAVSNNAWFGDSGAAEQMQQMARMRAREFSRWVLSATNDGVTAVVDHHGRTVARLPRFRAGVLEAAVEPRRGETPYAALGDAPVVVLAVLVLGLGGIAARRGVRAPG